VLVPGLPDVASRSFGRRGEVGVAIGISNCCRRLTTDALITDYLKTEYGIIPPLNPSAAPRRAQ
jgi:hypothetical protein